MAAKYKASIVRQEIKMTRVKRWLALLGAVLAFLAALQTAAWAQEAETAAKQLNPFTGDEQAIEEGEWLYMRYNCYGCHGRQGGGGIGSSIIDARWIYGGDDATLFAIIKEGTLGMPAYETLKEAEVWKIIAFVRALYQGPRESIVW